MIKKKVGIFSNVQRRDLSDEGLTLSRKKMQIKSQILVKTALTCTNYSDVDGAIIGLKKKSRTISGQKCLLEISLVLTITVSTDRNAGCSYTAINAPTVFFL